VSYPRNSIPFAAQALSLLPPLDRFDAPIPESHKSIGNAGCFLAMSGQKRRGLLLAGEALQKIQDQSTRGGVEIAGGFVGEKELG